MPDRLEGRTHEQYIRELAANVDGLEKLFTREVSNVYRLIEQQKEWSRELVEALKEQIKLALDASEKAVEKSERAGEMWRANANEWRGAMGDRDAKFAQKETVDREISNLRQSLGELRRSQDAESGKDAGSHAAWGYVATAIAIAGTLIATAIALIRVGGRG